ncbi:unnamed protein product [Amoebophrya sp. A120]|nr:unnamed protein product [Amoebophrya sp. A120]|eukprot:GSA120T00015743001.1
MTASIGSQKNHLLQLTALLNATSCCLRAHGLISADTSTAVKVQQHRATVKTDRAAGTGSRLRGTSRRSFLQAKEKVTAVLENKELHQELQQQRPLFLQQKADEKAALRGQDEVVPLVNEEERTAQHGDEIEGTECEDSDVVGHLVPDHHAGDHDCREKKNNKRSPTTTHTSVLPGRELDYSTLLEMRTTQESTSSTSKFHLDQQEQLENKMTLKLTLPPTLPLNLPNDGQDFLPANWWQARHTAEFSEKEQKYEAKVGWFLNTYNHQYLIFNLESFPASQVRSAIRQYADSICKTLYITATGDGGGMLSAMQGSAGTVGNFYPKEIAGGFFGKNDFTTTLLAEDNEGTSRGVLAEIFGDLNNGPVKDLLGSEFVPLNLQTLEHNLEFLEYYFLPGVSPAQTQPIKMSRWFDESQSLCKVKNGRIVGNLHSSLIEYDPADDSTDGMPSSVANFVVRKIALSWCNKINTGKDPMNGNLFSPGEAVPAVDGKERQAQVLQKACFDFPGWLGMEDLKALLESYAEGVCIAEAAGASSFGTCPGELDPNDPFGNSSLIADMTHTNPGESQRIRLAPGDLFRMDAQGEKLTDKGKLCTKLSSGSIGVSDSCAPVFTERNTAPSTEEEQYKATWAASFKDVSNLVFYHKQFTTLYDYCIYYQEHLELKNGAATALKATGWDKFFADDEAGSSDKKPTEDTWTVEDLYGKRILYACAQLRLKLEEIILSTSNAGNNSVPSAKQEAMCPVADPMTAIIDQGVLKPDHADEELKSAASLRLPTFTGYHPLFSKTTTKQCDFIPNQDFAGGDLFSIEMSENFSHFFAESEALHSSGGGAGSEDSVQAENARKCQRLCEMVHICSAWTYHEVEGPVADDNAVDSAQPHHGRCYVKNRSKTTLHNAVNRFTGECQGGPDHSSAGAAAAGTSGTESDIEDTAKIAALIDPKTGSMKLPNPLKILIPKFSDAVDGVPSFGGDVAVPESFVGCNPMVCEDQNTLREKKILTTVLPSRGMLASGMICGNQFPSTMEICPCGGDGIGSGGSTGSLFPSDGTLPSRMTWEHLFTQASDITKSPKQIFGDNPANYVTGTGLSSELASDFTENAEIQAVFYEYSRSVCRQIGKNKILVSASDTTSDYHLPENAHVESWRPWPECDQIGIRPVFYPTGVGYFWDQLAGDEGETIEIDPGYNSWFSQGTICQPGCAEPTFKTSGTSDRFHAAQRKTTEAALVNLVQNFCVRMDYRRTSYARGWKGEAADASEMPTDAYETAKSEIPALDAEYETAVFNDAYLNPFLPYSTQDHDAWLFDYTLMYDTMQTGCKAVPGWLSVTDLQRRIIAYLAGVCGVRSDKKRPTAFPGNIGRKSGVPAADGATEKDLQWFPGGEICKLAGSESDAETYLSSELLNSDVEFLKGITSTQTTSEGDNSASTPTVKISQCVPSISLPTFQGREAFTNTWLGAVAPKMHLFELHFVYTRLQEYCELVLSFPETEDFYTASAVGVNNPGGLEDEIARLQYLTRIVFGTETLDTNLAFRFAEHRERRAGCVMLLFTDTPDADLHGSDVDQHQPKGYVQKEQLLAATAGSGSGGDGDTTEGGVQLPGLPRRMTWENLFHQAGSIASSPREIFGAEDEYGQTVSPELQDFTSVRDLSGMVKEYGNTLCQSINLNRIAFTNLIHDLPPDGTPDPMSSVPTCTDSRLPRLFYPVGIAGNGGWEEAAEGVDEALLSTWPDWAQGLRPPGSSAASNVLQMCTASCTAASWSAVVEDDAQTPRENVEFALANLVQSWCVRQDYGRTSWAFGWKKNGGDSEVTPAQYFDGGFDSTSGVTTDSFPADALNARSRIPPVDSTYETGVYRLANLQPFVPLDVDDTSNQGGDQQQHPPVLFNPTIVYQTLQTSCKAIPGWLSVSELQQRIQAYLTGVCALQETSCEETGLRPRFFPKDTAYRTTDYIRDETTSAAKNLGWISSGKLCSSDTHQNARARLETAIGLKTAPDAGTPAGSSPAVTPAVLANYGIPSSPDCVPATSLIDPSDLTHESSFYNQKHDGKLSEKKHLWELHHVYNRLNEYCNLVLALQPENEEYENNGGSVFVNDDQIRFLKDINFGEQFASSIPMDFETGEERFFRQDRHRQRRAGCLLFRYLDDGSPRNLDGTFADKSVYSGTEEDNHGVDHFSFALLPTEQMPKAFVDPADLPPVEEPATTAPPIGEIPPPAELVSGTGRVLPNDMTWEHLFRNSIDLRLSPSEVFSNNGEQDDLAGLQTLDLQTAFSEYSSQICRGIKKQLLLAGTFSETANSCSKKNLHEVFYPYQLGGTALWDDWFTATVLGNQICTADCLTASYGSGWDAVTTGFVLESNPIVPTVDTLKLALAEVAQNWCQRMDYLRTQSYWSEEGTGSEQTSVYKTIFQAGGTPTSSSGVWYESGVHNGPAGPGFDRQDEEFPFSSSQPNVANLDGLTINSAYDILQSSCRALPGWLSTEELRLRIQAYTAGVCAFLKTPLGSKTGLAPGSQWPTSSEEAGGGTSSSSENNVCETTGTRPQVFPNDAGWRDLHGHKLMWFERGIVCTEVTDGAGYSAMDVWTDLFKNKQSEVDAVVPEILKNSNSACVPTIAAKSTTSYENFHKLTGSADRTNPTHYNEKYEHLELHWTYNRIKEYCEYELLEKSTAAPELQDFLKAVKEKSSPKSNPGSTGNPKWESGEGYLDNARRIGCKIFTDLDRPRDAAEVVFAGETNTHPTTVADQVKNFVSIPATGDYGLKSEVLDLGDPSDGPAFCAKKGKKCEEPGSSFAGVSPLNGRCYHQVIKRSDGNAEALAKDCLFDRFPDDFGEELTTLLQENRNLHRLTGEGDENIAEEEKKNPCLGQAVSGRKIIPLLVSGEPETFTTYFGSRPFDKVIESKHAEGKRATKKEVCFGGAAAASDDFYVVNVEGNFKLPSAFGNSAGKDNAQNTMRVNQITLRHSYGETSCGQNTKDCRSDNWATRKGAANVWILATDSENDQDGATSSQQEYVAAPAGSYFPAADSDFQLFWTKDGADSVYTKWVTGGEYPEGNENAKMQNAGEFRYHWMEHAENLPYKVETAAGAPGADTSSDAKNYMYAYASYDKEANDKFPNNPKDLNFPRQSAIDLQLERTATPADLPDSIARDNYFYKGGITYHLVHGENYWRSGGTDAADNVGESCVHVLVCVDVKAQIPAGQVLAVPAAPKEDGQAFCQDRPAKGERCVDEYDKPKFGVCMKGESSAVCDFKHVDEIAESAPLKDLTPETAIAASPPSQGNLKAENLLNGQQIAAYEQNGAPSGVYTSYSDKNHCAYVELDLNDGDKAGKSDAFDVSNVRIQIPVENFYLRQLFFARPWTSQSSAEEQELGITTKFGEQSPCLLPDCLQTEEGNTGYTLPPGAHFPNVHEGIEVFVTNHTVEFAAPCKKPRAEEVVTGASAMDENSGSGRELCEVIKFDKGNGLARVRKMHNYQRIHDFDSVSAAAGAGEDVSGAFTVGEMVIDCSKAAPGKFVVVQLPLRQEGITSGSGSSSASSFLQKATKSKTSLRPAYRELAILGVKVFGTGVAANPIGGGDGDFDGNASELELAVRSAVFNFYNLQCYGNGLFAAESCTPEKTKLLANYDTAVCTYETRIPSGSLNKLHSGECFFDIEKAEERANIADSSAQPNDAQLLTSVFQLLDHCGDQFLNGKGTNPRFPTSSTLVSAAADDRSSSSLSSSQVVAGTAEPHPTLPQSAHAENHNCALFGRKLVEICSKVDRRFYDQNWSDDFFISGFYGDAFAVSDSVMSGRTGGVCQEVVVDKMDHSCATIISAEEEDDLLSVLDAGLTRISSSATTSLNKPARVLSLFLCAYSRMSATEVEVVANSEEWIMPGLQAGDSCEILPLIAGDKLFPTPDLEYQFLQELATSGGVLCQLQDLSVNFRTDLDLVKNYVLEYEEKVATAENYAVLSKDLRTDQELLKLFVHYQNGAAASFANVDLLRLATFTLRADEAVMRDLFLPVIGSSQPAPVDCRAGFPFLDNTLQNDVDFVADIVRRKNDEWEPDEAWPPCVNLIPESLPDFTPDGNPGLRDNVEFFEKLLFPADATTNHLPESTRCFDILVHAEDSVKGNVAFATKLVEDSSLVNSVEKRSSPETNWPGESTVCIASIVNTFLKPGDTDFTKDRVIMKKLIRTSTDCSAFKYADQQLQSDDTFRTEIAALDPSNEGCQSISPDQSLEFWKSKIEANGCEEFANASTKLKKTDDEGLAPWILEYDNGKCAFFAFRHFIYGDHTSTGFHSMVEKVLSKKGNNHAWNPYEVDFPGYGSLPAPLDENIVENVGDDESDEPSVDLLEKIAAITDNSNTIVQQQKEFFITNSETLLSCYLYPLLPLEDFRTNRILASKTFSSNDGCGLNFIFVDHALKYDVLVATAAVQSTCYAMRDVPRALQNNVEVCKAAVTPLKDSRISNEFKYCLPGLFATSFQDICKSSFEFAETLVTYDCHALRYLESAKLGATAYETVVQVALAQQGDDVITAEININDGNKDDVEPGDEEFKTLSCPIAVKSPLDPATADLATGLDYRKLGSPLQFVEGEFLSKHVDLVKTAVSQHCSAGWKAAVRATKNTNSPVALNADLLQWIFLNQAKTFPGYEDAHTSGAKLEESLVSKHDCTVATYLEIAGEEAKSDLEVMTAAAAVDCNVWTKFASAELRKNYKAKKPNNFDLALQQNPDNLTLHCTIVQEEIIVQTLAPITVKSCEVSFGNPDLENLCTNVGSGGGVYKLNTGMSAHIWRKLQNCKVSEINCDKLNR